EGCSEVNAPSELKAFPFLHRSPSQSLSPSFLALLFTSLFGLCSLQQDLGQPRSVFLGLNLVWRRRKPLPFRDGLPSRQSARSVPPSITVPTFGHPSSGKSLPSDWPQSSTVTTFFSRLPASHASNASDCAV